MFQKILQIALRHKIAAVIIILLAAVGGYYGYKALSGGPEQVRYVSAAAEKGTLIVSISGSGQVSVYNQIDITPKVSGEAVYIGAKEGQEVKAGTLLIQLDTGDAQKSVRDAEANLESAKLDLEKLKGPENAAIPKNKEKAQDNLKKAYEDGFNTVANVFLDLPDIMAGLNNVLYTNDKNLSSSQWNIDHYADAVKNYNEAVLQYKDDTNAKYQEARKEYDQNFQDYKSANRLSDTAVIEKLINETHETTRAIADTIKSASNLIQFYKDNLAKVNLKTQTTADTHLSTLNTYTGKTNAHLLNLLNVKNTIEDDKDAISNADIDVASQELALKQRENALLDARGKLADYYIRAPFSGVVAEINVQIGDSVSGSAITFITRQKIAEISLNEVDVAKVKVGQKATLTFDAIEGLSISGEVAEIDTLGTVTQGVVVYNVKIVFDTQDERVKPGMSVTTAIITDIKQDVLFVPNSAVKSEGNAQYVEVMIDNAPQQRSVETGLSNDTVTEIVSGLKEGEQVVTQTITANTTQTQSQSSTGLRIPGLGGVGR